MQKYATKRKPTKKQSTLIYGSVWSSVTYGVNLGNPRKEMSPHTSGIAAVAETPQSATSGTSCPHSAGQRGVTRAIPGWDSSRELGAVGELHTHTNVGLTNPFPGDKCPLTPEQPPVASQRQQPRPQKKCLEFSCRGRKGSFPAG